jgi:DNA modification methylase
MKEAQQPSTPTTEALHQTASNPAVEKQASSNDIRIEPTFRDLLPPLTAEERRGLEESLKKDGLLHPLIVWKGKGILIDGHHRLEIASKLGIPITTTEMDFANDNEAKRWIIQHHVGRRNLSPYQRCQLALRLEPDFKARAKNNQRQSKGPGRKGQRKSDNLIPTDVNKELADLAGVSRDTFAKFKRIVRDATPEVKAELESGKLNINAADWRVEKLRKERHRESLAAENVRFVNPPLTNPIENTILCEDVIKGLKRVPDGCVSLVFTSPPYDCGKPYGKDRKGTPIKDNRPWPEYLTWLQSVWTECHRVLRSGGRLVVNIASIRTREKEDKDTEYKRPIVAELVTMMRTVGLHYRDAIVWHKPHVANGRTNWGSYRSPSHPTIRVTHEHILVWSKDQWKLPNLEDSHPDMTAQEFMDWTESIWTIAAESQNRAGHPCPFPPKLAERVIKLYCFPNDLVLDCFNGSGTTTATAAGLGRKWIGIDANPTYCKSATERTNEAVAARCKSTQSTPAEQSVDELDKAA